MLKSEKQAAQAQLKAEKAVLKEIEAQYKQALDDIDEKIASLLGRNDADMQNVIYQVQYQRQLKTQVQSILEQLQANEFETISQFLTQSYTDGYVGAMYTMHSQGVPIISPIDQRAVIRAVQTDSKLNHDLYTELGVDITKLKKSVTSEITRGIATGMMYDDIARNISLATKAPLSRTKTIVRTESHRIQQASAHDAYMVAKSKGADVVKQWDSTLDGATRPLHQRLDGQIVELEEPFKVGGMTAMYPGDFGDPAQDCNCRCRVNQRAKWALGKEELQTLKDRAKFFGLEQEKEQTFTEFKKKYIKAVESIPVARASSFTAAKTLEEAEEYAQRFVSKYKSKYTGNVSFKGMDVDHANTVNRVLTTVFDDYDIDTLGNVTTMNFRESKWKSAVDDGVAGAYQWGGSGGTLYVNQKLIGTAKVETAFTGKVEDLLSQALGGVDTLLENPNLKPKQRTYLEALKKSGVQCVAQKADDFTESVIVHEAGHMLDDKVFRKAFKEAGFDLSASMDKYASEISGYAVSTSQEYVAESFASYWMGNTEILDPDLVKIFESTKGGAAKNSLKNLIVMVQ